MQSREFRYAVILGLLLVGSSLYGLVGDPEGEGVSRWPSNDKLYTADQWAPSAETVEQINGAAYITRTYAGPAAAQVILTIVTNQSPKLFGPGAEVPFQGSGYDVSSAPPSLTPLTPGVHALVASQGAQQWLVLYAYGEQRGLIGSGPLAWGFAVFDGVIGRRNDYYRLFLMAPYAESDPGPMRQVITLSDTVFPRVAAWYST